MKETDLLKSKHQTRRPLLYSNQHVIRIPLSNYHVNSDDFYLTLFKINLLLCRHFGISAVLLFNRFFESVRAIIIFSVKYKSHLLVPHLYQDVYDFILHFRWYSVPFPFNTQRYLDSSASLIWDMFLNNWAWLFYLDLNSPSDASWYSLLVVLLLTSALYTIHWWRHLTFRGQLSLILQ